MSDQDYLTVHIPFDATDSILCSGDTTAELPQELYTYTPSTDKGTRQWLPSLGTTDESFDFVFVDTPRASAEQRVVPYVNRACSEHEELCLSACSDDLSELVCSTCAKNSNNCACSGSGTYFVVSEGAKRGVFKPCDEEQSSPLMQRYGIAPGSCWMRESAASLLSGRVPCTLPVEFWHADGPKIGSLQRFVNKRTPLYPDIVQNFGASMYRKIGVREVHNIGVLDIRILNGDRNSQNLLLSKDEREDEDGHFTLIPIDHGLAFPETLNLPRDCWVWLEWEQAKLPFDPVTVRHINDIDIARDIEMVRRETNLSARALQWMRVAHLVLKKGANLGLTLFEIGSIIARDKAQEEMPSALEAMVT